MIASQIFFGPDASETVETVDWQLGHAKKGRVLLFGPISGSIDESEGEEAGAGDRELILVP